MAWGWGLAVSSWSPASIYSPAFHVGFGPPFGVGVRNRSEFLRRFDYGDDYYDDYYYDDYHHRDISPTTRTVRLQPPLLRWWGYPNPCWDSWGPVLWLHRDSGSVWAWRGITTGGRSISTRGGGRWGTTPGGVRPGTTIPVGTTTTIRTG